MSISKSPARAIADVTEGLILATVDIAAPVEKVFRCLTDPVELVAWWGSEDLYRAESCESDFRVGGLWTVRGRMRDGKPYAVRGEYLLIEPPSRLVQTWAYDWDAAQQTTVAYQLEAIEGGTRVIVRHSGFRDHASDCRSHSDGWQLVLTWLREYAERRFYYHCRLIPPRPDFPQTMSDDERTMMTEHAAYWSRHLETGSAIVFGPVADPAGVWGVVIACVAGLTELETLQRNDPAIRSERGFRYETLPMMSAVTRDRTKPTLNQGPTQHA
jgi:uncharacterized protein YndB with AHSA1/START domain